MKADLTRNTFDPMKHFTRVLMQQGRVQLDSDWNEQAAILLHRLRVLAADVIGQAGGPGDRGFALSDLNDLQVQGDFRIGLGHYYVDGLLCEADSASIPVEVLDSNGKVKVGQLTLNGVAFAPDQILEVFDNVALGDPRFPPTPARVTAVDKGARTLALKTAKPAEAAAFSKGVNPSVRAVITYLTQPDMPSLDKIEPGSATGIAPATYLVYLDAWERHITFIEDGSIREVALGGPDTATRGRLVWQVKLLKGRATNSEKPCDKFSFENQKLVDQLNSPLNGRLKARAKQSAVQTDPCIISPDASYQGAENQLYRVEVHDPGIAAGAGTDTANAGGGITAQVATFKWSRENGSVAYAINGPIVTGSGVTTVTLASLGRDDRYGLSEGDWVEIQDDDYMLQNKAGSLLKVQSIDRSNLQVTLTGTADPGVGADPAKHPLLRRWDHKQGDPAEGGLTLAPSGAARIEERDDTMWLLLEDGVQIQFQPAPKGRIHQYRTGDYWLIPARTATGDVEWPVETVTDNQGNPVTSQLEMPPIGIRHHYAPLGVVTVKTGGSVTVLGDKSESCRHSFKALTQL